MNLYENLLTHWYFHIPNFLLAALMYTLVGRYLLEMFFRNRQDVVILRVFRSVTDPVLRLVRTLTPAVVPNGLVLVFTIIWLMAIRLGLVLAVVRA